MNPLANELNTLIQKHSPAIFEMLSNFGKEIYFPKGILSQSAEAKQGAHKYNATIGIAKEKQGSMYLPCIMRHFKDLKPEQVVNYAPGSGILELRKEWKAKIIRQNPTLKGAPISMPVVTNGLTHGLFLAGDLFVNPEDLIILPDKIWGNYRLIFEVRKNALLRQFSFFSGDGLNLQAIKDVLETEKSREKIILLLNFPNNPTGYSIKTREASKLTQILTDVAKSGQKIITIIDDAYFGMFYEEDVLKESIFASLASTHENLLAIKLDGATKEQFVWGFRTGFMTFGIKNGNDEMYDAMVRKLMGCIRSSISNSSVTSQNVVLSALKNPTFHEEQQAKIQILKGRALKVKEVLSSSKYDDAWDQYPFNAGYFMCLRLKNINAEKLRQHLLKKYGIGVIAVNETDVRIAFSCLEEEFIQDLFDTMYKATKDLS
ncbi:MAG: aminotransferase class I/II-fold pyridoxal phosphate-dependent enzyme [Candidatus Helarchaeota archaeon]